MKYLEMVLLIMMLSLSIALFNNLGLIPLPADYGSVDNATAIKYFQSTEQIDQQGEILNEKSSMASKVMTFTKDTYYSKKGFEEGGSGFFGSFEDLGYSLLIMSEVFWQGTINIGGQLSGLKIPESLHYLIMVPLFIMYLLALVQIISGRNIEGGK